MSFTLTECRQNWGYSIATLRERLRDNINERNSQYSYRPAVRNKAWGKLFAIELANIDEDNWLEVEKMVNRFARGNRRSKLYGSIICALSKKNIDTVCQCDDCSAPGHEDMMTQVRGDAAVCENCLSENYHHSDCEDEYIPRDEASPMYSTRRQLRNSEPDDFATETPDGYRYSEAHGAYLEEELYYELNDENDEREGSDDSSDNESTNPLESIGDYHSSRGYIGRLPSAYDRNTPPLLLGLELEVECGDTNRENSAYEIRKLFNQDETYCGTEGDGSLTHGFEIVTGYTGLDTHERILKRMKDSTAFTGLKSHNTETCGLHVHIDRADISPIHALRLVDFMHDPKNRDLIVAIARRYGTGYCEIKDKTGTKKEVAARWEAVRENTGISTSPSLLRHYASQLTREMTARYEAINMTGQKTIEFRIFRGTLKFETIMACLEFTRALWLFTREHGDEEMTTAHFLVYIQRPENRRETRYLRHRLKSKKYQVVSAPRELDTLLIDKLNKRKKTACVS